MAALVLGEFVRVRWRAMNPLISAELDRPGRTAREVDALLGEADTIWGLLPGQEVRLSGQHLREQGVAAEQLSALLHIKAKLASAHENAVAAWSRNTAADKAYPVPDDQLHMLTAQEREALQANEGWDVPYEGVLCLPASPPAKMWTGPGPGRWLIAIESAAHCWAALPGVNHVVADHIVFDWTTTIVPGASEVVLGIPVYEGRSFELVYPPPPERERQAALGRDGELPTTPFKPSKGVAGVSASPVYRYGCLEGGVTRWLDLPPTARTHPALPATETFRAKLAELGKALARRGVFYMDAPDEKYHHRHSFEDALERVPSNFGEENPPVAYSVSGELDNTNKEERAEALYIPDRDEAVLYDERIGFRTLPSETEVTDTGIIYVGGQVRGIKRSQRWTGWTIAAAAREVGLRSGGGGYPDRQIDVFMPDPAAQDALPVRPVDAEVLERAARIWPAIVSVARAGVNSHLANAAFAGLYEQLLMLLRLRAAFEMAAADDWFGAFAESADVQATAGARETGVTPPFSSGVDPLAAVIDHDEVRLAFYLCRKAAEGVGTPEAQAALLAARDAWNTYREPKWWVECIDDWLKNVVDPVLACGEAPADNEDLRCAQDDRHVAPAALRCALESGSVDDFAAAWAAAEPPARDKADLWLLIEAIRMEQFDIAELLITECMPISGRTQAANNALGQWGGETPLAAAIEAGSLKAVRWCLAHGPDATAAEWSRGRIRDGDIVDWPTPALVLAAKHGQPDIVRDLLERGSDPVTPMANGITPLAAAAFGGSEECVEILLAAGAEANQPPVEPDVQDGPEATTPLLCACDRGHDDVVRLLLACAADPNVPRGDGELALQLAMGACAPTTIEALLAAGANGGAINRDGLSVLHTAMLNRRADAVPLLLAAGAPIDLPAGACFAMMQADAEPGWTALMIAAAQGDNASVSALLDAGANPLATDGAGRTALDLARLAADPNADIDTYDVTISMLEKAERSSAV